MLQLRYVTETLLLVTHRQLSSNFWLRPASSIISSADSHLDWCRSELETLAQGSF